MAVAFRSLIRVTEGTKCNVGQRYYMKNTLNRRINYRSTSTFLGTNIDFSRKALNDQSFYPSSQYRKLHVTTVQAAEIVKFHLSDIGKSRISNDGDCK